MAFAKILSVAVAALAAAVIGTVTASAQTTEETVTSCDDGVHDFIVKKYDESNHWYECSVCGVADELLCHNYDENGDTICNGCSYERSIIEEVSIDKTLLSESETATITLKVIEGYTAKWIYFYKPITGNTETVYLYFDSDNTYTGSFCVDDQTEAGIWKAKYMTLKDAEDGYVYLYNSSNYTGTYYDKEDLSSLNFEVVGTNADVIAPVIENYSIDKGIVSAGEKVTVSIQVTDDHLPSSFYFWYKNPSSESECVSMKKIDDTGLYQGAFSIDENSESGLWRPYYFTVSDTNGNSVSLYNSKVTSYGSDKKDLSSLNFEVVEITEDENEDAESFIVKFTDGYGNTLSTQRVNKDQDAVEPETPTNELYLFSGWDKDFTNITCNTTVNATWVLNPNVVYDKEAHIGKTFSIEVYSAASQTYTITCSEDVDFTSSLVSSGMIFTDQLYYSKKYEIDVNAPGSYLFYVKGSKSSNTLTYKVKITDHDFDSEYIIDKAATCTEDGSKYRKCTVCTAITDVTTIEKLGHDYADEWTVDKAATCAEAGSKSHHCSRCEATTDVTSIEALGHDYSKDWIIDKTPTCTEDGRKSHHCTICDQKTDITVVEALGHDYGDIITVEPTYAAKGYTLHKCKNCSDSYKDNYTAQLVLDNVSGLKLSSNTASSIKMTWNKVNGATGYVVYQAIGGKWQRIKVTSANSLTVSNLKAGTNYRFTVRAYKTVSGKNYYSPSYTGVWMTTLPANISGFKVSATSAQAVKLTWNKVNGATGYVVYRAVGGKWQKVGVVKTNSFYEGKLASGTNYRYAVRAYKTFNGKNYYSAKYPTLWTSTKPATVNFKLTAGTKKATVSWSKVTGATGYKVYYKTSAQGSWKGLKTTTGTSFTKTGLTSGKTYYFTVKAYKTFNGTTYNGSYTTKSVKVK